MTGKGMLVPATAAFCSVTVCAVLGLGWYQTWHAVSRLRREIALARMDQQATLSTLARWEHRAGVDSSDLTAGFRDRR